MARMHGEGVWIVVKLHGVQRAGHPLSDCSASSVRGFPRNLSDAAR